MTTPEPPVESVPESKNEPPAIGDAWGELSPEEEAMETLLDDFMPTLMAATLESLGKDRDNEVVRELKHSLQATEVDVVKEALFEAEFHNLSKHPRADEARVWLAELKAEVAAFDEIREQRRITDETSGATVLCKLLAKASDMNMESKKGKKHGAVAARKDSYLGFNELGGEVVAEEVALANRMATRGADEMFSLDTYAQDEAAEEALDRRLESEAASRLNSAAANGRDDEESERKAELLSTFRAGDKTPESTSEEEESEEEEEDEDDKANNPDGEVTEEEDEHGNVPPPKPIDMPALWRMRVPRHRKLIKDSLHHLGKCTSRLDVTADAKEVESLHRRLRLVCTVGDNRAMVELKVMTEVMHLNLEDPSRGNRRTALHYAASEGRERPLRFLLRRQARIHAMDDRGNTPLHLAAANNHSVICQVLVYKGAGTARQRRDGANVLHVAAMSGSTDACRALLSFSATAAAATDGKEAAKKKKGAAKVDSVGPQCVGIDVRRGVEGNSSENTALLCAAMGMPHRTAAGSHGWREQKKQAEDDDDDDASAARSPYNDDEPPEILSNAQVFHEDTVRLLLEWGADWNIVGEHGTTLLHLVCAQSHLYNLFLELVEEHNHTLGLPPPMGSEGARIIAAKAALKAEIEAEEEEKKKPKEKEKKKKTKEKKSKQQQAEEEKAAQDAKAAAKKREIETRERRENEAAANNLAEEALMHRMRHKRMLNVNGRNGDGNTPLHVAIYNRNRDVAKVFLRGFKCSCDLSAYLADMRRVRNPLEVEPPCTCPIPPLNVNLTNDYGYTSLHAACRHHDLDLIKLLLDRKANKNRLATLSGGPLHMAVAVGGAPDIVNLLLSVNADVHLRNNQHGRTPLQTLCCDAVRPWDDSKGCLRPFEPLARALLDGHKDHANDRDREGRSALALAVLKARRLKTVELLLNHRIVETGERSCNPDLPDKQGITPFIHAMELGRMDLVTAICDASEAAISEAAGKVQEAAKAKRKRKKEAAKQASLKAAAAARAAAKGGGGDAPSSAAPSSRGSSDAGAKDEDEDEKLLGSRGCITIADKSGRSPFHVAAAMPQTNPGLAVIFMRTLMERLSKCPPGLSAWTAPKVKKRKNKGEEEEDDSSSEDESESSSEEEEESSSEEEAGADGEEDDGKGGADGEGSEAANKKKPGGNAVAKKSKGNKKKKKGGGGGGGGGVPSAVVQEEWSQLAETGETAWHLVVRHKLTKAEEAASNPTAAAASDGNGAAAAASTAVVPARAAASSSAAPAVETRAGMVRTRVVEGGATKVQIAEAVLQVMLSSPPFGDRTVVTEGGGGGGAGDPPLVRKLDHVDVDGETCLQAALSKGNLAMVRLLLEYGESHNLGLKCRTIRQGRTSLVTACDMGLLDEASRMIDLGARVNEGDRRGFTPLMACCRLGVGGRLDGMSAEALKRVDVDHGGDEGASSKNAGMPEMDPGEEENKSEMLTMLLEKDADPNKVTEEGDTALHFVCEQASSPVQPILVKKLLAAGANPAKVNKRLDTPLHLAVETCEDVAAKSSAVVESLCQARAPVDAKNRKRRTPYEHAVALNKPTLASIIATFDEFAAGLEKKKKKKKK